jgi:hypothetical protein
MTAEKDLNITIDHGSEKTIVEALCELTMNAIDADNTKAPTLEVDQSGNVVVVMDEGQGFTQDALSSAITELLAQLLGDLDLVSKMRSQF